MLSTRLSSMTTTTLPSVVSQPLSFNPVELRPNVFLQRPLSRCKQGPGLILIWPLRYSDCQNHNASLDPVPLEKWAEESFAVAQVTVDALPDSDTTKIREMITAAKDGLTDLEELSSRDRYGLIGGLKQ